MAAVRVLAAVGLGFHSPVGLERGLGGGGRDTVVEACEMAAEALPTVVARDGGWAGLVAGASRRSSLAPWD